jgi:hypothetical protein
MILELRNKTPFITFGFNRISKTASTGEVIDVWLNTLYNEVSYPNRVITAPTATVTKVNNYHYRLTYGSAGAKTVYLDVQDAPKDITLTSNILNIDIEGVTFDSDIVTFDNNIITFDNE